MRKGSAICLLSLGLIALLGAGCTHATLRSGSTHCAALPASIAAEYACPKQRDCPCKVKELEENSRFTIRRVELLAASDNAGTNRWIELDYYDIAGKGKTPVLMVLPMLGGGYSIERHFARYFASHGYAAVIVRRDRRGSSARVEDLNRLFVQMVKDHKQVIDWMETQEDLDCTRLGIFGVSMGAIKGALLLPLESRIQAAALGLVGGDLPYILTHTTEEGLAKRREQELREKHLTLPEAEARLRTMLSCDPIAYARYVDPRKVLLVLARYDTVVPIKKGIELKEKMGNPETIMLPAGHYSAVLSLPYIESQSMEFFEKRFAAEQTPVVQARRTFQAGKH
jgi:hypothetical protein